MMSIHFCHAKNEVPHLKFDWFMEILVKIGRVMAILILLMCVPQRSNYSTPIVPHFRGKTVSQLCHMHDLRSLT